MPDAAVADLEDELGDEASAFDAGRLETLLRRGATLVRRRIPESPDAGFSDAEWVSHREDLQVLVAAHFAFGEITGETSGKVASSISQESASIEYSTSFIGPGDYGSPYWDNAVKLDERINYDDDGQDFAFRTF